MKRLVALFLASVFLITILPSHVVAVCPDPDKPLPWIDKGVRPQGDDHPWIDVDRQQSITETSSFAFWIQCILGWQFDAPGVIYFQIIRNIGNSQDKDNEKPTVSNPNEGR